MLRIRIRIHPDPPLLAGSGSGSILFPFPEPDPDPDPIPTHPQDPDPDPFKMWILLDPSSTKSSKILTEKIRKIVNSTVIFHVHTKVVLISVESCRKIPFFFLFTQQTLKVFDLILNI